MIEIKKDQTNYQLKVPVYEQTQSDTYHKYPTIRNLIKSGRVRFKNIEEWRKTIEEIRSLEEQIKKGKIPKEIDEISGIFDIVPNSYLKELLESIRN